MSADKNSMSNVLITAHSHLLCTGLYLADENLSDKVHWVVHGHGHMLALLPQYMPIISDNVKRAVTNPTTSTAMGNMMTGGASSSVSVPSDSTAPNNSIVLADAIDGTPNTPGLAPITPSNCSIEGELNTEDSSAAPHMLACLAAIVHVDSKDFWLSADGGYQGPNHICKEIVDVKPSCAIGMLNDDFSSVITNLCALQDHCVMSGYSPGKSFFSADAFGNPCFKMCHTFLEPLEGMLSSDDNSKDSSGDGDNSLFSFENWPLTKEKNQVELLALKSTHQLVPLAAMDVSGHQISPYAYRRCLQDAIIEVHFTFSHWGIARNKQDVYAANIVFMCILVPPRAFSMPANKWIVPQTKVTMDSAAKKSHSV
ncbi:hypothetical protein BKA82DRAFT_4346534 [Pisolithus tinctorius]|nr:hypothetical protein BKA82DRAFT_4346534 [Pisolithus tinctorius]